VCVCVCVCLGLGREEVQRSCGKPTCCSHPCQIEANEGQADPWMQALSK